MLLNFNAPFQTVYNQIRGLSPYPGAYTMLNEKRLKILATNSTKKINPSTVKVGELITNNKDYLYFVCSDGCIECTIVKLEGKKSMDVKEFLRGWKNKTENTSSSK